MKGDGNQKHMQKELSNLALLVIDVQQGLFKKSTPIYMDYATFFL